MWAQCALRRRAHIMAVTTRQRSTPMPPAQTCAASCARPRTSAPCGTGTHTLCHAAANQNAILAQPCQQALGEASPISDTCNNENAMHWGSLSKGLVSYMCPARTAFLLMARHMFAPAPACAVCGSYPQKERSGSLCKKKVKLTDSANLQVWCRRGLCLSWLAA